MKELMDLSSLVPVLTLESTGGRGGGPGARGVEEGAEEREEEDDEDPPRSCCASCRTLLLLTVSSSPSPVPSSSFPSPANPAVPAARFLEAEAEAAASVCMDEAASPSSSSLKASKRSSRAADIRGRGWRRNGCAWSNCWLKAGKNGDPRMDVFAERRRLRLSRRVAKRVERYGQSPGIPLKQLRMKTCTKRPLLQEE